MKRILAGLIAMLMTAMIASAANVKPLGLEEGAMKGATHVATITYADFTETVTNTAQTFGALLYVPSNTMVELVYWDLVTPFKDTATNGNSSVAVIVGDGSDTDYYLASTETCIYGNVARAGAGRSLPIVTTTNCIVYSVGGSTGVVALATGITATGKKVYTANDYVDFTFTPHVCYALTELDQGEMRFYFNIRRRD